MENRGGGTREIAAHPPSSCEEANRADERGMNIYGVSAGMGSNFRFSIPISDESASRFAAQ